jgi:hypothetical protein
MAYSVRVVARMARPAGNPARDAVMVNDATQLPVTTDVLIGGPARSA